MPLCVFGICRPALKGWGSVSEAAERRKRGENDDGVDAVKHEEIWLRRCHTTKHPPLGGKKPRLGGG